MDVAPRARGGDRRAVTADESHDVELERAARIANALDAPVSEVMDQTAPRVHEDSNLQSVTSILLAQEVSAAPVVDGQGRLVGVVSGADIVREAARSAGPWPEPADTRTAADVMNRAARVLPVRATLRQATETMASDEGDCVPVVGEAGKVLGVLRARDVLCWLFRQGSSGADFSR